MDYRDEKGAIVVEATISLTSFFFAMLLILSIMNICLAQAKIGLALNSAALQLSEYSYLIGLTGLNDKHDEVAQAGEDAKTKTNDITNGVSELFGSVTNIKGDIESAELGNIGTTADSVKTNLESAKGNVEDIKEIVSDVAEDPKAFIVSFGAMVGNDVWNQLNADISSAIAKSLMKKNLTNEKNGNAEEYLRWLRVVPKGDSCMSGLDFAKSKVFYHGDDEAEKTQIKLVVKYKVRAFKLLGIEKDFIFEQCAYTRGWF